MTSEAIFSGMQLIFFNQLKMHSTAQEANVLVDSTKFSLD